MKATVACRRDGAAWSCEVVVGDDAGSTRHEVRVGADLLQRLRPGSSDPTELVSSSFAYLLRREPRESILRGFDLEEIGRYFPEWETTLGS